MVNVEIKSFPERPSGLVDRVLDVIDATGTAERTVVSSFDHEDVALARRPGRRYALGVLVSTPLFRIHDYASNLVGADAVHVSTDVIGAGTVEYQRDPSPLALRHEMVKALSERGIPVLVYTVNQQTAGELARHLAQIGVCGVYTDDPRGWIADD
jgi:glycerophosphoryl diester phosphodiesterase